MRGELFTVAPEAIARAVDADAWIAAIVEFEVALAHAEEGAGVAPAGTGDEIAGAAARVELSLDEMRAAATPVIPIVDRLADAAGDETGRWVHFGATSQDALDTAMVLVARRATQALAADLCAVEDSLARLAHEHRTTVMAGRTLLQQASPTTFGVTCARWLAALREAVLDLHESVARLPVQLGGAVGTGGVLGPRASDVRARLSARLGLPSSTVGWHSARGPVARLGAALGIVAGVTGKVARDIVLLAQTEIGELAERPGESSGTSPRATSSAMPHKRNAVAAIAAVAAARRAAPLAAALLTNLDHELERAAGAWQSEADLLSGLFVHTATAAARLHTCLSSLHVDRDRMRANIDPRGAWASEIVAARLAVEVGRATAHDAVRRAAAAPTLREGLAADERVAAHVADLDDVLADPLAAAGPVDALIDAVLTDRGYSGGERGDGEPEAR